MRNKKTLTGDFHWHPPEGPGHKPETRRAVLWLKRGLEGDGGALYFVNGSNETLDFVSAGAGGFITCDDEVAHVASAEDLVYRDVKPNQAVLVDEYDGFYDLDYVLNVSLRVRGPELGDLKMWTLGKKGGEDSCVLLWDNGDPGKHVNIAPWDPEY